MAGRYVSDFLRANVSMAVAIAAGVAVLVALPDSGRAFAGEQSPLLLGFLVAWPVFVGVYLAWTHISYARQGPRGMRSAAQRETRFLRSFWRRLFGHGGASTWTMTGAFVAVGVTIYLAQTAEFRGNGILVALGLLCVSCSWALMSERPIFADFLTFAVLVSTMAATVSARVTSRRAWTLVRLNVLFDFAFNSVIVAMMVSLLFGGLLASRLSPPSLCCAASASDRT
ncbi:DUF1345 domain-containing protein [Microbacterium sp. VKM Ac-2923]|uniref:DUF1345 domain-containing protein n=1 Tax=Microbacterium sp. VKM Ac-2923 TaxID=2929476 RepID=UPI001FB46332|nr:DUF1345 domain-containing protein [Microbacterium sp. VKM Ac-2923]MCJ1709197.1 DUF1345 domain-containing protein [Microbacterium sp. VKM Ac-2923]